MRNCKLRYLYFDRGCNMITAKIGNRIRELRTQTGLSQEKFAQKNRYGQNIFCKC